MNQLLMALHQSVTTGSFDASLLDGLTSGSSAIHECEMLDFKEIIPQSDAEYAKTLRDLVAFHNSYGGFLVFGVKEAERDRKFELIGTDEKINIAKLRDKGKDYFGKDIRITCNNLSIKNSLIEVLWVEKRSHGVDPVRFKRNGPEDGGHRPVFKKDDVVFRQMGNNAIAKSPDDYSFLYSERIHPADNLSNGLYVNEPINHNLPDRSVVCSKFVGRKDALVALWRWMADPLSRVRLIAGEGGLGKTSLAYCFAENIASTGVKRFEQVVWLTAKRNRFSVNDNSIESNYSTDFYDARSLFSAIGEKHGCSEEDYGDNSIEEVKQAALDACSTIPSFIVIDDIDSLSPEDQRRALEFGLQVTPKTKLLMTTRVNLSYSIDNVLTLNGFSMDEYIEYVSMLRTKYTLPSLSERKVEHIWRVSSGSPLFTDSLFRLEMRGIGIDSAIKNWENEKGMDVRKFALEREIGQLGREAKRVLYVICYLKNVSLIEISLILRYAEQTLGDAIEQLKEVFLVAAPPIKKEVRFTTDPNTARLVLEMGQRLGIDHSMIEKEIKRARSDAIGVARKHRDDIVGRAISQANASYKLGDPTGALNVVLEASKKSRKPHMDLLLAIGRFCLLIPQPDRFRASSSFKEAYELGQRKPLLFDLWFKSEVERSALHGALDVAGHAIECNDSNLGLWYERRASVRIALARRPGVEFSKDSALREYKMAVDDLREAKKYLNGKAQRHQVERLIEDIRDSINSLELS